MDDSNKGRYYIILVRDLLTALGLNLKFYGHSIESYDGTFKGSTAPMVDMGKYGFKDLNTRNITSEESFKNTYVE